MRDAARGGEGAGSAIDGRTTRHAGYAVSQRKRKRDRGGVRLGEDHRRRRQGQGARPRARALHWFTLAMAAYNLIRMPRLLVAA